MRTLRTQQSYHAALLLHYPFPVTHVLFVLFPAETHPDLSVALG